MRRKIVGKNSLHATHKITPIVIGAVFLFLVIFVIVATTYMNSYKNPADKKLAKAGVVEKTAQVGAINFNYAEGPDNGPALLLLHAQLLDWYTYSSVLPELSTNFHVFAVDYPGHGKTTYPADYPMTANQIGSDLANFIQTVIGEPAYVTGNSSGGLLTTWLAANRPNLVKAIVLEDPPLFSAEYPEIKHTIAYKAFATSYQAVQEGYTGDFLDYWIANSAEFFRRYAGPFSQPLIKYAVKNYKAANPGKPVEIAFLPVSVREVIRGLHYYDPHFGAAFYDGTWHAGFDHAEALRKIQCPVLLLQANFEIEEDGTLYGAMSQEQAGRAVSLLQNGRYVRVDSPHVINLEHPDEFIQFIEYFFFGQ
jgi:pimeloyl-ACP methyl ester carboxylesterase